jgi:putative sterol carrier protein
VGTIVGGTSEIMREIIARIMIDQVGYQPVSERLEKQQETNAKEAAPGVAKKEITPVPKTASEILQTLPERFLPENAGDWETVFHFDISGPEGGQFTVNITKGKCSVESGFRGEAKCTVSVADKTYHDIELGRMKSEWAFMTGNIRMSDMAEMMRFTKMFRRLPKS